MKSTKVEIHGILHLDVDIEKLSESDIAAFRALVSEHFRDVFDRMYLVGTRWGKCVDRSVAVVVS